MTPDVRVGQAQVIPVRGQDTYWINDSVFPFLPDKTGAGRLAFWGDGVVRRYAGPDIDHLAPAPDGKVPVENAPGKDRRWFANGTWMLTATRAADGVLVGFVHGEDHKFADGQYGEWNSTGVWTSNDDGVSWVNQGEAIGSRKPDVHAISGLAMNECLWDAGNKRWLGYSGPYAFVSTDLHALPGTWRGYNNGAFSQPIDVSAPQPPLTPAPGLEHAGVTWGGLTYNSFLKQFIMTWVRGRSIRVTFSSDGLHWGRVTTLFRDRNISYASIIGETDTRCGQDCSLVYMYTPPGKTISGNRKDMMRRPVHFEP
jgi:hypothetical protein